MSDQLFRRPFLEKFFAFKTQQQKKVVKIPVIIYQYGNEQLFFFKLLCVNSFLFKKIRHKKQNLHKLPIYSNKKVNFPEFVLDLTF